MKISQLTQLANPGPDVVIPVAAGSENFKVTLAQIAGACNTLSPVPPIGGFETPPAAQTKTGSDDLVVSGVVVFDADEPTFWKKSTSGGTTTYYRYWKGWEAYKDQDEYAYPDRLYLDEKTWMLYHISDDSATRVGFPYAESSLLKNLETRVNELEQRLGTLAAAASETQSE